MTFENVFNFDSVDNDNVEVLKYISESVYLSRQQLIALGRLNILSSKYDTPENPFYKNIIEQFMFTKKHSKNNSDLIDSLKNLALIDLQKGVRTNVNAGNTGGA